MKDDTMTLDDILALWWARDVRYDALHHKMKRSLAPEERAAIRAWRTTEIDRLPPESRAIAWLELAHWSTQH